MIKLIFLLTYNFIRFQSRKILSPNRVHVHYIQRISPCCSIKSFDNGQLVLGKNCEASSGCDFQIHGNGVLKIGDGVYFNRYCMISAHQQVAIGNHCIFGPGVKVFDNNHKYDPERGVVNGLKTDEIVIGNNCWIASDVVILKGVHIGDNTVIGAGCVIYHDIPSKSVVINNQDLKIRTL